MKEDYDFFRDNGIKSFREGKYSEAQWQFQQAISVLGWKEAETEFRPIYKWMLKAIRFRGAIEQGELKFNLDNFHFEDALRTLERLVQYSFDPIFQQQIKYCKKYALLPFKRYGKYGYKNHKDKEVIASKFEAAKPFRNSRAAVYHEGGWMFINRVGNRIIDENFDEVDGTYGDGMTIVKKDLKWNFIKPNHKLLLSEWLDSYPIYNQGLISVEKDGNYGFCNEDGDVIIPMMYEKSGHIFGSNGTVAMRKNNRWGYIDKVNDTIIDFKYEEVSGHFEGDDLVAVKLNNQWGFIDKKGDELLPFEWEEAKGFYKEDEAEGFSVGVGRVKNKYGKWGGILPANKVMIPFLFDRIDSFRYGIAVARIGDDVLAINNRGVILKTI